MPGYPVRAPTNSSGGVQPRRQLSSETSLRLQETSRTPGSYLYLFRTSVKSGKFQCNIRRGTSIKASITHEPDRCREAGTETVVDPSADTLVDPCIHATATLYPDSERSSIQEAWQSLIRWSRLLRGRGGDKDDVLSRTRKIVVFGGGSFGTALASVLARRKLTMEVVLLIRDEKVCADINENRVNTRYLKEFRLPDNVRATVDAAEAIRGAQFALLAVPCQHSRAFLRRIKPLVPPSLPIICVSKGLELRTGDTMSDIIASVLGRQQPTCFLSGPSFAREIMEQRPTGLVAASEDPCLAARVQELMASDTLRINTSDDVVGVEICGALKNVLAIAAGIVDGMDLGHNAQAALVVQGCAEIRWLAERMGAKPTTVSGLSGLGDIMLTCYVNLSRNRTVGLRLGAGEKLPDILESLPQVAEGVATAGVVVALARKYRVQLPVLTAVAQVLGNELGPKEAVQEIMQLPQVAER
uniref:Glycerol-3-phosphate dehydrogenase [NAD(+)] n=1 Tax=Tetraselmis sp. GSL018 TaxID=582737 RepID=A0A061SMH3_9CHLO|mmetsp:Transcript_10976/g.26053  ORF Transcript_10976/g.26053 Transcript_10976/m.26053 type:complete len:471 (-) Transcript_10976:65-1477(-)